jgi:uncharacterized protein (DUF427 family)
MSRPRPVIPGPGQESVWDYPRPPRLERSTTPIRVVLDGVTIVDTDHSWRVLETSSPPVYYVDRSDVAPGVLQPGDGASWCEWKGQASYFDLVVGATVALPLASRAGRARRAAWGYHTPNPEFAAIAGHVAIYAGRVDACFLGGEAVRAQPGDFYGGWITSRVTGPFKGDPGTLGW